MTRSRILDYLPEIYHPLLPQSFNSILPPETLSTCEDCVMLPGPSAERHHQRHFFSPETKCCTFFPVLPNYLVGAMLEMKAPDLEEGRARLLGRIRSRSGVYPQGIFPPPLWLQTYEQYGAGTFGQSRKLRCPYFLTIQGGCSVWPVRNAICATWFCKYEAGRDGKRFWSSVRKYISHAEQSLTASALLALKWPSESIFNLPVNSTSFSTTSYRLSANDLDESPPEQGEYRKRWGKWSGREVDFYTRCYTHVQQLGRPRFRSLLGVAGKVHLSNMRRALRQWQRPVVPVKLRLNPRTSFIRQSPEQHLIMGLDGYLEVPSDMRFALENFDGCHPWRDTLRSLKQREGVIIDQEVVLLLYRKEILIDAN